MRKFRHEIIGFGIIAGIRRRDKDVDFLQIPKEGPILAVLPILAIGILFGLAMDYQV